MPSVWLLGEIISLAPIPPSPCIHALSHETGCCSRSRGRQGLCSSSFASGLALCFPLAIGGSDSVSFPSLGVQGPHMFLPWLGEASTKVAAPPPSLAPERTHVELPLAQTSVKSLAQPCSSLPLTDQLIKSIYCWGFLVVCYIIVTVAN